MKTFLLTKAIEKDIIDVDMEKKFAETNKPICIEY